jgi:hypothetical protein
MRTHIDLTIAAICPYLCFGMKSISLLNIESRPDILLRRPDGYKREQFEGSRHRVRSGRKFLVIRTDDAWMEYHVVRTDARDLISLTDDAWKIERLDGISRLWYSNHPVS